MALIGIIGGSTDIATIEYYKIINATARSKLGGLRTARIIINSMDVFECEHYVRNNLWEEGSQMVNGMAKALERAGVDFIICVSNTWHRVADKWMGGVDVPLLHIVDPTANAIKGRGLKKVALLGTKATMSASYMPERYREKFGIEVIVPSEEEQKVIDDVIWDELSHNRFTEESRQAYLMIVDKLQGRGAEGVILGCTEIGLLIKQEDRPKMPMFDTLRLHAEAAAEMAIGK